MMLFLKLKTMKQEKTVVAISGYVVLTLVIILTITFIAAMAVFKHPLGIIIAAIGVFLMPGFFYNNPNTSRVLVLFGDYKGTVKENGFFWVNPFYYKIILSLRARNFDSEKVKVNDKLGNPIQIGVILVWRVRDTYKAAFEVDKYEYFVKIQSESAVRKLAGTYAYDNFDDEQKEITLRSAFHDVNVALEKELQERLAIAGLEVIEARIGYLAYAPEIAHAMLRRQQATAVVAARMKIVEGAVSMVEAALRELSRKSIIDLDEDKKASMVSNLMVVLCADRDVNPVINAGTLNN
jgi:hypothetical protein